MMTDTQTFSGDAMADARTPTNPPPAPAWGAGATTPAAASSPTLKATGPLRQNLRFQALWIGSTSSTLGVAVADIAYPLLILMITGSPAKAGLFAAVQTIGMLAAGLPAGSLADRYDPRSIVLVAAPCRGGRPGPGHGLAVTSAAAGGRRAARHRLRGLQCGPDAAAALGRARRAADRCADSGPGADERRGHRRARPRRRALLTACPGARRAVRFHRGSVRDRDGHDRLPAPAGEGQPAGLSGGSPAAGRR